MSYNIIDLTHILSEQSPSWNGGCGFHAEIKQDYSKTNDLSFRVQQIKLHAGIGTHMDAPAHCVQGGITISEIPIDQLIGPGIRITIPNPDQDYCIQLQDVLNFEAIYGEIPLKAIVIFHTGWGNFWAEPNKYHNNHQFPYIAKEVAEFLVTERHILGLGIDTLSPDRPANGFGVHEVLLGASKFIIENVANAQKMPPTGSTILALPIKIGTTEAPMRLIALQKFEK